MNVMVGFIFRFSLVMRWKAPKNLKVFLYYEVVVATAAGDPWSHASPMTVSSGGCQRNFIPKGEKICSAFGYFLDLSKYKSGGFSHRITKLGLGDKRLFHMTLE